MDSPKCKLYMAKKIQCCICNKKFPKIMKNFQCSGEVCKDEIMCKDCIVFCLNCRKYWCGGHMRGVCDVCDQRTCNGCMKYCGCGVQHCGGCGECHHKRCTRKSFEKKPAPSSSEEDSEEDSGEDSNSQCHNPKHSFYEWFYDNIELGPADGDIHDMMIQRYKAMTGGNPFSDSDDSDSDDRRSSNSISDLDSDED